LVSGLLMPAAASANHSVTQLVSTGPLNANAASGAGFSGMSRDGSRAFFYTSARLTSDDSDGSFPDVYERSGGVTKLISTGPSGGSGAFFPGFVAASNDGSHVFFATPEDLVPEDVDGDCVYSGAPPNTADHPVGGMTLPFSLTIPRVYEASFDIAMTRLKGGKVFTR